jgi:hypothetical protein
MMAAASAVGEPVRDPQSDAAREDAARHRELHAPYPRGLRI